MKKDLTLVIMAAGMGSRFGGLKQIEPVGPNGEFIIDYSIYDAVRAGFNKVVFIIKEENFELFKETIGKRVERQIKVEYVFQRQEDVPAGVVIPSDRKKPWGTSHAILSAKNNVIGNFLVLNADDFYGKDAFQQAADFFKREKEGLEYAVIGYKVINTLTENGSVKRGVCEVKGDFLTNIIESSVIEENGKIIATPLDGRDAFEIDSSRDISMNMFCFTSDLFKYIDDNLEEFFEKNKDDLSSCEYLIPDTVTKVIEEKVAKVRVIPTVARWQGITSKEDKVKLVNEINELIEKGDYPQSLWI